VSDRSYPGGPRFTTIKTIPKVDLHTEYPDRSTFDTRLYEQRLRRRLALEGWDHINLTGDYVWSDTATYDADGLRPLNDELEALVA
jgi:hypothetical protein